MTLLLSEVNMTNKTFTFDISQIKAIYRAGISRGHEEEASFQCGSRVCSKEFDELVNVIYDIVNENKNSIDHADFIQHSTIERWFK